jgi:SNF2 family DNA or RNA helicase
MFRDERARQLFGDYPPKSLALFRDWHAANPHVYRKFRHSAFRIKATKREHYSAYPIFYHMRFEFDLQTTGDVFKINNAEMATMKLDPVQIEALKFAENKPGVGYFLEMGLGKTLLALEEFKRAGDNRLVTRMVVVAPNSFKRGWLDEIEKHGFAFQAYVFVSGSKRNDAWFSIVKYGAPPVLIINYEAIRTAAVLSKILEWMKIKPTMLVLDESIQIKTHNSLQTKAALSLALQARLVRLLTGRPQTQGPHDLYPQLRALGLFQGQKFWSFRNTFCAMGGWENKQVVGVKNADALARIMAPVVFQARKADWLPDLPRKDFAIHYYEMSGEQATQYKQMRDEFRLELESKEVVAVDVAVSKYEKLSQIQCGFILSEDGVARELVRPEANPRLLALFETLDAIEGKAIIIYRHRYTFDILYLYGGFDSPAYIKGGMKPEEIAAQKDRFNNDPSCRILLGQCESTKYGHTLLGGEADAEHCSTMIFFENSYSLDTRTQVEDRIHRRGQRGENVLYIDLAGTELDRRVVRALQKKEDLYEAVFSKLRVAEPV